MHNLSLKKLYVTSNLTLKVLPALAAATLLATLSARAQAPAPTSDIIFFLGQPILTITDNNPPGPPEVITVPIPSTTPLNISIGVVLFYEDQAKTVLSDAIWFDGNTASFVSDPDLSTIPTISTTFPLLASVVETGAPQDVSIAFGLPRTGILAVQSEVDVPDAGTTGSLFGLSLTGLAFLRRKLC